MRFGPVPVADSAGLITAHSLRSGGETLRKGSIITPAMAATLEADGVREVVAVSLETGDVGEDAAAGRLAAILAGENLRVEEPFTGRCNLFATTRGILLIDRGRIDSVNGVDEAVTVATLPAFKPVAEGEMVATVKIIPYAVGSATLARACAEGEAGAIAVAPYRRRRVGVVSTRLASLKDATIDKTLRVLAERLAPTGAEIVAETRVPHTAEGVASGSRRSSTGRGGPDGGVRRLGHRRPPRRDPGGDRAGGRPGGPSRHAGRSRQPAAPGRAGDVPVIGAPGCARSPSENGFDWILQRLLADVPVSRADIVARASAGCSWRSCPARSPARAARRRATMSRIGIVLLAAGRGTRFGEAPKLLATLDGVPLVRRVAEAALAARPRPVVAVLGANDAAVRQALAGLDLTFVRNGAYADGLSTSLKAGIAALPDCDAAIVMLGDMPLWTRPDRPPRGKLRAGRAETRGHRARPWRAAGQPRAPQPAPARGEIASLSGDRGAGRSSPGVRM